MGKIRLFFVIIFGFACFELHTSTKHILRKIPETLETKRLIMRPPKPEDEKAAYEAIIETFDQLRQTMIWAQRKPTLESLRKRNQTRRKEYFSKTRFSFDIYNKKTGTYIGMISLKPINWDVPCLEIGYWCRKQCQGNGFITEAAKMIVNFAFKLLHANRVEITCSQTNIKSKGIPKRLGFILEGILKNERRNPDGSLRNTLVYAKTHL